MYSKKDCSLFFLLRVSIFLTGVLLAWFIINPALHLNTQESVIGKEIQFVERSDLKLWLGKILDRPVSLIGDYIVFRVEYLNDKKEKSRISVIFKPNFKWLQTNSRDFNVGDEILFFQVIFTFEKGEKEAFFCPIGIYYPCIYKGESIVNGYQVVNALKKK